LDFNTLWAQQIFFFFFEYFNKSSSKVTLILLEKAKIFNFQQLTGVREELLALHRTSRFWVHSRFRAVAQVASTFAFQCWWQCSIDNGAWSFFGRLKIDEIQQMWGNSRDHAKHTLKRSRLTHGT
jgi:hypothetical protein